MPKFRELAVVLGFLIGASTANAQGLDVKTIVAIDGDCERYEVGAQEYACSGLMYLSWKRGRVGYMLPTKDGGSLMMSGGSDSQLTPERYVLNIDKITISLDKETPLRAYKATGKCSSILSTDAVYVRSISCDVSNGTEDIVLRFKGGDKPVQIKNFK